MEEKDKRSFMQNTSQVVGGGIRGGGGQGNKKKALQNLEGRQPYPIARLSRTIGFSGNSCPDIRWSRDISRPNELIYASGSLIVSSQVKRGEEGGEQNTGQQRFF